MSRSYGEDFRPVMDILSGQPYPNSPLLATVGRGGSVLVPTLENTDLAGRPLPAYPAAPSAAATTTSR